MAHYRRGRKVPALPPVQRHAVGGATIVVVFALVGLTAWKPAVFVPPSLVGIALLGALDHAVVTTRARPAPVTEQPRPARSDALANAETMAMPSLPGPPPGEPDDDLSWSPDVDPRLDDPNLMQTMAIDMGRFLDNGGGSVWGR